MIGATTGGMTVATGVDLHTIEATTIVDMEAVEITEIDTTAEVRL